MPTIHSTPPADPGAQPVSQNTHQVLTLVREIPADLDTPVSVYLKLKGDGPSFLLESVTGGEQVARYSFIGFHPRSLISLRGQDLSLTSGGQTTSQHLSTGQDPLDFLRQQLQPYLHTPQPDLPRFSGGLVGYFGYETVRFFEPGVQGHLPARQHPAQLPDALFLLVDTIVAFDHAFGRMLLILNQLLSPTDDRDLLLADAERRLDAIAARLAGPLPSVAKRPDERLAVAAPDLPPSPLQPNLDPEAYTQAVRAALEYISAGDIFQVVLSQRFSGDTTAQPFEIYRALRRLNPSPYMFFFDFGVLPDNPASDPLYLIGASPELHVRLENSPVRSRQAALRPIAGTRPRGADLQSDQVLAEELLADHKERAEHIMLVDLARNDLGRVCTYGTVSVPEMMVVERYSHVMHIVSHVTGELQPGLDAFDLLRATFPAGTVSGAPKVRAMQIIAGLEQDARGAYAGAVGYFSMDGSLDTCITIRTILMSGSQVHIQAGAGIVADSDPEREYQETLNKARALALAVNQAEKGPKLSSLTRRPL